MGSLTILSFQGYNMWISASIIVCSCVLALNAFPQGGFNSGESGFRDTGFRDRADLEPQEQQFAEARDGGSAKTPGGYFQYVNVPAHKEYEFGWNRGNPKHYISRYEQNKDHRFRTRVRWGDAHDGYGEQYWEYNHGPQKYGKEKEYKPAPAKPVYASNSL